MVRDATDNDHAVSKSEMENAIMSTINQLKSETSALIVQFINNQVKNRIGRKTLKIPKTNYQWIKLLHKDDLDIESLEDVIVLNVYIEKRSDRYHHAKSELVLNAFGNLELFFNDDMTGYYMYFDSHTSSWHMSCIVEYLFKPKEISAGEQNE